MLLPSEFTVGTVGNAKPLSLVLPTNEYGETMLVGQLNETTVAVFLSEKFRAQFFESEENEQWNGIIIPDIRIEVDETSLLDVHRTGAPFLSVIRTGTKLVIAAQRENPFGRSTLVTLHDSLASAGEFQAAFTKWQVVIGEGQDKRVMWSAE